MFNTILIALVSTLAIGCGNYQNLKGGSPNPQVGQGVPDKFANTPLDFELIKTEFLQKQCIECHTGRHTAYANYEVVRAAASAMLERMQSRDVTRLMPKGGPALPAEQIALFKAWVDAGAPEVADSKIPGDSKPKPKPEKLGFEDVVEGVFKPYNCIACHSQYNDYTSTYLDRGSIVSLVSSNAMPFPAKQGGKADPVSDAGKQMLLGWVAQGAPEVAGGEVNESLLQPELQPTWISLRNQVFGPKCILCHNDYGARAGKKKAFNTYSNLLKWYVKNPSLFHFDQKEGEEPGLLVTAVTRPPDSIFEIPMPYNNPFDDLQKDIERITPVELAVIQEWIKLKLPENEDELPKTEGK